LFETVRGGKRIDDVFGSAGRLGFRASGEARFGGFLGAAGLLGVSCLRGRFLREGSVREEKNKQRGCGDGEPSWKMSHACFLLKAVIVCANTLICLSMSRKPWLRTFRNGISRTCVVAWRAGE
jgi:hypothetical protein